MMVKMTRYHYGGYGDNNNISITNITRMINMTRMTNMTRYRYGEYNDDDNIMTTNMITTMNR